MKLTFSFLQSKKSFSQRNLFFLLAIILNSLYLLAWVRTN